MVDSFIPIPVVLGVASVLGVAGAVSDVPALSSLGTMALSASGIWIYTQLTAIRSDMSRMGERLAKVEQRLDDQEP